MAMRELPDLPEIASDPQRLARAITNSRQNGSSTHLRKALAGAGKRFAESGDLTEARAAVIRLDPSKKVREAALGALYMGIGWAFGSGNYPRGTREAMAQALVDPSYGIRYLAGRYLERFDAEARKYGLGDHLPSAPDELPGTEGPFRVFQPLPGVESKATKRVRVPRAPITIWFCRRVAKRKLPNYRETVADPAKLVQEIDSRIGAGSKLVRIALTSEGVQFGSSTELTLVRLKVLRNEPYKWARSAAIWSLYASGMIALRNGATTLSCIYEGLEEANDDSSWYLRACANYGLEKLRRQEKKRHPKPSAPTPSEFSTPDRSCA